MLRNNNKLYEDFIQVASDCLTLYAAKTHDYGNSFDEAMNKLGMPYAVGRLYDKMNRLVNLCGKEDSAQVKDESLDDTLMDLANYAIMTLSYRRYTNNRFAQCMQEGDKIVTNPDGTRFNLSQLDRIAKHE